MPECGMCKVVIALFRVSSYAYFFSNLIAMKVYPKLLCSMFLILPCIVYGANQLDELISVNGRELHIRCQGNGMPTVILEAGSGSSLDTWKTIQPEIANFTRVCSYSRAGIGKSSINQAKLQIDADETANDLHALLHSPKVIDSSPPPYVLVGHSYGGLYSLFYLFKYPKEVAGMVLMDATSGNMGMRGFGLADDLVDELIVFLIKKQAYLKNKEKGDHISLKHTLGEAIRAQKLSPDFIKNLHAFRAIEDKDMNKLEKLKRQNALVLKDKPLKVIVASNHEMMAFVNRFKKQKLLVLSVLPKAQHSAFKGMIGTNLDNFLKQSLDEKKSILTLSTNSAFIIAKNSGHNVYIDSPDVVIKAIKQCISYARHYGK